MREMQQARPEQQQPALSKSKSLIFFIGQNQRGLWVVQDQAGRRGGLFVSRAEALRFVYFENDGDVQAMIWVSSQLELDFPASGVAEA